MSFNSERFCQAVDVYLDKDTSRAIQKNCGRLAGVRTPEEKADIIGSIMSIMDERVDAGSRSQVMQACGRWCVSCSALDRAKAIKKESKDLGDFLRRLNREDIGGLRYRRSGSLIRATRNQCVCEEVNKATKDISATYCQCSCGWLKEIFGACLRASVDVELKKSIINGDDICCFAIRIMP